MQEPYLSLVVAQASTDGPRIVSDTRVVLPHEQRPSFKQGTLKAIVIRRDLVVCFAGDVVAGLDGIREFAGELDRGRAVDDLLGMLQERTLDDRRVVEFILATDVPDAQLMRLQGGTLERNLESSWIGDHAAFERFQQARYALTVDPLEAELDKQFALPPSAKLMSVLQRAMAAVIADPPVQSVDDFCVSIAHKPTGFQYLESTFLHVGRDIELRPGDDLISRMAQPVEEGGYAVSVVEPEDPGMPALGLSFPRARLGMLYLPLKYEGATVIENVSPKDFPRIVFERFGVAMKQPPLR
jgi:hypothetical protein